MEQSFNKLQRRGVNVSQNETKFDINKTLDVIGYIFRSHLPSFTTFWSVNINPGKQMFTEDRK